MAIEVNSRDTLKDWCLRSLGWPVIQINVDDDQVEDRIDEAIQYFQQFHYDGTERMYLKHQLTDTDINTNQYLPVANNVVGISRIFPISTSTGRINMFDIRYQLRLQDLQTFTGSGSIVNYWNINTHLALLDQIFNGATAIRFNRLSNKLYIDWHWENGPIANDHLIMEAFVAVDPEVYNRMYNDRTLKEYATALIKRQWGNNLKLMDKIQLVGGITLNGQQIFNEADAEVQKLKDHIRNTYESPPQFFVG